MRIILISYRNVIKEVNIEIYARRYTWNQNIHNVSLKK